MLAWNRADDMAIADQVEKILGQPVIDRSVVGAHVIYQLPVSGKMVMCRAVSTKSVWVGSLNSAWIVPIPVAPVAVSVISVPVAVTTKVTPVLKTRLNPFITTAI